MRRAVWVHRLAACLLLACFGGLLPAHHHAPGDAEHAHGGSHAARHTDDPHGHDPTGHEDHDAPARDDHPFGCGICYAARTLYTPVAVALPVLAPDAVCTLRPAEPDQVVSVRLTPVYHGRAPPLAT